MVQFENEYLKFSINTIRLLTYVIKNKNVSLKLVFFDIPCSFIFKFNSDQSFNGSLFQ